MRLYRNKKGEGTMFWLIAVGFLLGGIYAFGNQVIEDGKLASDPFYSAVGDNQIYLKAVEANANVELYKLDLVSKYVVSSTVLDESRKMLYLNGESGCGSFLETPILNSEYDNSFCENYETNEVLFERMQDAINTKLYTQILLAGLSFNVGYDYSFIQNNDTFSVVGYADNVAEYPLNPKNAEFLLNGVGTYGTDLDISKSCNYFKSNADEVAGKRNYECEGDHCVGKCPTGLKSIIRKRKVPYFNQCYITYCAGQCQPIEKIICDEGCMLKSVQMAYAYYDYFFDERQYQAMSGDDLRNSFAIERRKLSNIKYYPIGNLGDTIDELPNTKRVLHSSDKYASLSLEVYDKITDNAYEHLLDMLKKGLVVMRLRTMNSELKKESTDIRECNDLDMELGYSYWPSQHFVLAIAGNNNYIVLHDPYTKGRDYKVGMNVVVSRDFIDCMWTGRYMYIGEK